MAAPLIVSSARIEIMAMNFMAEKGGSDCGQISLGLSQFGDDPKKDHDLPVSAAFTPRS
jgi:hypothetical protein